MNLKDLPKLQDNISLARYTTFRIGGPARYFVEVKSHAELIAALDWAREKKVCYIIIGGGSNVLFLDSGFDGLVIKNSLVGLKIDGDKIVVDSGCDLHRLVLQACQASLGGLESLAWIPGTVGGAIYGNVGIRGTREIGDVIESVEIYDVSEKKQRVLSRAQCKFSYRQSVFKSKATWVVLGATLKLQPGAESRALQAKCTEIGNTRQKKFPPQPSAGCVFANVPVEQAVTNARLQPFQSLAKGGKIAAGLLIDRAGLKGQKIGGALVSPQHANFIVNTGTATADDVLKLISLIKARVRDMFGVNLECEVQIIK